MPRAIGRSRFRKRTSDISGFDYIEIEMIREKSLWIGSDERDDPPPSKLPLGGEGEISQGTYFRSLTSLTIDSERDNPVRYITAGGGITADLTHPYVRVVGSNNNVTITANPRISTGRQSQVLTLFGVGSSITLNNGNGVALMASAPFVINSGSVITFIYNTGGTVWQETSRYNGIGIGG